MDRGFLRTRRPRLVVNRALSAWSDVDSGIPQGALMWPLLNITHTCELIIDMATEIQYEKKHTQKKKKHISICTWVLKMILPHIFSTVTREISL